MDFAPKIYLLPTKNILTIFLKNKPRLDNNITNPMYIVFVRSDWLLILQIVYPIHLLALNWISFAFFFFFLTIERNKVAHWVGP